MHETERDVRCDRAGCRAGPCGGCRTPFHPKEKKKKNVCVYTDWIVQFCVPLQLRS